MRKIAYAAMGVLLFASATAAGRNTLTVPLDGQRDVAFEAPIATLYIKNPDILDAKATDKQHVTLFGRAGGETLVQTFDATGAKIDEYRVVVGVPRRRGSRSGVAVKTVVVQRGRDRTVYACTAKHCISAPSAQLMQQALLQAQPNGQTAANPPPTTTP